MRFSIFSSLIFIFSILFSCTHEELIYDDFAIDIDEIVEQDTSPELKVVEFFQKNNAIDQRKNINKPGSILRCGGYDGSNNLVTCQNTSKIKPIAITTSWGVLNTGPGNIDHELEQNFARSCKFSYRCIKPCGFVQSTFGTVDFIESPRFNPNTFEYDLYTYLSSEEITIEKANELKNHFDCKIRNYQQENYPGWIVSQVDFYGEILLCNTTGISDRYLSARFKLTRHQCP